MESKADPKVRDGPQKIVLDDVAALAEKDDFDLLETLEVFRLRMKKFMNTTLFGRLYLKFFLILSIVSTMEYIYVTYLTNTKKAYIRDQLAFFQECEYAMAALFSADWLLTFAIADKKLTFIKSFYSMVDLFTIIPTFALLGTQTCPAYMQINSFVVAVMYTICAMKSTRILRALRIHREIDLIEDVVQRAIGEIVLTVVVMIFFTSALVQFLDSQIQPRPFHEWTYGMWITASTVGYGDVTPFSDLGRFADMGMICFAIIKIPQMTNDLIEKMNLQSIYARMVYTRKNKSSTHVIICGDLHSTSVNEFLEELFHVDHEAEELHCVILQPENPSYEMLMLLQDPKYTLNVTYMYGSALVEKDLDRCCASLASAIFIMSNKFSSSADEEDSKSILQQFSIKRYIQSTHVKVCCGTDTLEEEKPSFYMQLIRPENRRHLVNGNNGEPNCDVVVCLNELKMGIIAKSVMFAGTSTLIMNLIASFADAGNDDDDGDGDDAEVDVLQDDESSNWIEEYQKGCDWEIYMSELSDVFEGTKFSTLSELLYQKLGVVLFGLQVEDLRKEKSQVRILLNPGDFLIPPKSEVKVEAFVMAKNKKESDLRFEDVSVRESIRNALTVSILSHVAMINVTGAGGARQKGLAGSIQMIRTNNNDDENHALPWQKLLRKLGDQKADASAHQEAIQRANDLHLRENHYVRSHPMDLADAIIKTSVTEEIHNISDHVIIMGKSLNNLFDLIRPLRARYLGALKYIVILYPDDVPFSVWQRISIFEAILVVRGSPLEEADIRRAGIFKAQQVIVLGSSMDSTDSSAEAGHSSIEALVDADAIFSYQCVRRMNERAQVVVEMVRTQNIAYLDPEFSLKSGDVDYKFTPQFAAGYLFTSSLLDTIVCQAFYNPQIVKVVNKLVGGLDHRDHDEIGPSRAAHIKPTGLMAVASSALYQISIPDSLESRTYGALYKHLAEMDIIPLGILRGIFPQMNMGPKSNTTAYVFTNPPKDTELFSCDKVYVLSQKPLNFNKKASKELEKEMHLYETVRKKKNVGEDTMEALSSLRGEIATMGKAQDAMKAELEDLTSSLHEAVKLLQEVGSSEGSPNPTSGGSGISGNSHLRNTTLKGPSQTRSNETPSTPIPHKYSRSASASASASATPLRPRLASADSSGSLPPGRPRLLSTESMASSESDSSPRHKSAVRVRAVSTQPTGRPKRLSAAEECSDDSNSDDTVYDDDE